MKADEIETKLRKLPDHLIPGVLDYIEFLLSKYGNRETTARGNGGKFTFDWEGGLSKLKDRYTSVELQHKAMDWR